MDERPEEGLDPGLRLSIADFLYPSQTIAGGAIGAGSLQFTLGESERQGEFLGWRITSVLPGEPIPIEWSFTPSILTPSDYYATVSVEFDGLEVWRAENVKPRWGRSIGYRMFLATSSDSTRAEPYQRLVIPEPAASRFYKIGTKTLRMVVTVFVTGAPTDQVARRLNVAVRPEILLPEFMWFVWSPPRTFTKRWKKDSYTLPAEFRNRSEYGAMALVQVKVVEEGRASNVVVEETVAQLPDITGPVTPGGTAERMVPVSAKTWEWHAGRPTWAIDADALVRTFAYRALVTMTDIYGNRYHEIQSIGPQAIVRVPDDKSSLASAATALAVTAADLKLLSIPLIASVVAAKVGAAFAAAAALAYAAAEIAGWHADDPPEPDSDFLSLVQIEPPAVLLPRSETFDAEPLEQFMATVLRIQHSIGALTAIHAKLMGAREADSIEGATLQETAYQATVNQIGRDARDLSRLAAEAEATLLDTGAVGRQAILQALAAAEGGIPVSVRNEVAKSGLDAQQLDQLNTLISNERIRGLVSASDGVPPLQAVAQAHALIHAAIQADVPAVFDDLPEKPRDGVDLQPVEQPTPAPQFWQSETFWLGVAVGGIAAFVLLVIALLVL